MSENNGTVLSLPDGLPSTDNRELGTGTAVITHNAEIACVVDRGIHFSSGRITVIDTNPVKRSSGKLR